MDLPKLTQKLESLSARKSFEPLNPVADTDVEGYLKNERENAIIAVIEEINKNVSQYWISIHYHMYKVFSLCPSSLGMDEGEISAHGYRNGRVPFKSNNNNNVFPRIICRSSNQLKATRSAACTPSGAMRRSVC